MPTSLEREFISPNEAARRLQVSYQSVRTWLKRGLLEGQPTALGTLVDAESVEQLAEQRRKRASRERA